MRRWRSRPQGDLHKIWPAVMMFVASTSFRNVNFVLFSNTENPA